MIRYARQMLVRRYGTSYACRLIISIIIMPIYARLSFHVVIRSVYQTQQRYAAIADYQKTGTVRIYDVTRRLCVLLRLQNRKSA